LETCARLGNLPYIAHQKSGVGERGCRIGEVCLERICTVRCLRHPTFTVVTRGRKIERVELVLSEVPMFLAPLSRKLSDAPFKSTQTQRSMNKRDVF
jgi:hypothetical protein